MVHAVPISSEADLDLVDNLAWAAGWGFHTSGLAGSKKNFSVYELEVITVVCFERVNCQYHDY